MSDTVVIITSLLFCVLCAVALYPVVHRIISKPKEKEAEQQRAAWAEETQRIIHPDWAFYERHLQRPVPGALRELFSDQKLVTAYNLKYDRRNEIGSFNSLNDESFVDSQEMLGHGIVPIAYTYCGDAIYLRPGATEPDTVWIAYHDDPGEAEVFANSVADMLTKVREENFDGDRRK